MHNASFRADLEFSSLPVGVISGRSSFSSRSLVFLLFWISGRFQFPSTVFFFSNQDGETASVYEHKRPPSIVRLYNLTSPNRADRLKLVSNFETGQSELSIFTGMSKFGEEKGK